MNNFEYAAPESLQEILDLLRDEPEARLLAGGTDLITQLDDGRRTAKVVVDLKRVPSLMRLEVDDDGLHIGAARTLTDVRFSEEVRRYFPALIDACGLVGSRQIQNRGTVVGNVCNAAPSADTASPLIVHDARVLIASNQGKRMVPIESFFTGPGQTVLQPDEMVEELQIPIPDDSNAFRTARASAYERFIPRNEMDIAVAGVASYVEIDADTTVIRRARVALTSVAPTPVRATGAEEVLVGRPATESLFNEAADAAMASAKPITDVRGSEEFRTELVRVLTRKTLETCMKRIEAAKLALR